MSFEKENNLTSEFIESANITIFQSKNGYRYGEEPFTLANISCVSSEDIVLDMGAGCGIIGILIARKFKPKEVVLIEIQDSLAKIIHHNIIFNKLKNTQLINDDFRKISEKYKSYFTKIFSNPPFTPANKGRICVNDERKLARMEINGTLLNVITSAHTMLQKDGMFYIVLPESRNGELLSLIDKRFIIKKTITQKNLNYYSLKKLDE